MLRITGNHHTESIEASFDIAALKKAQTKSARYAVAMKASEEEAPPAPRPKKPSDLLPSPRSVWDSMTQEERNAELVERAGGQGIKTFLRKQLGITGLEIY